jgi:hypothetical protein
MDLAGYSVYANAYPLVALQQTGRLMACFWSNATRTPIRRRDEPPALGVVGEPGGAWPIGMAFPVGQVAHHKGPAVTFRLMIGKVELEGRWLCLGREFIRLGEAAEEL